MVGNGVRLLWLIGLSLPIIMLLSAVAFLLQLRPHRTNHHPQPLLLVRNLVGWCFVGVCLLATVYAIQRFSQLHQHVALIRQLDVAAVEYIQLADHRSTDPQLIATLITDLRQVEPFSPNHGGWLAPQPLTIAFRSGEQLRYAVAFYSRTPGIVFFSAHGDLFCAPCTQVLEALQE